ncbi:hypothetical protein REPUB_Repub15cG0065700 [Reevesia pubescens]
MNAKVGAVISEALGDVEEVDTDSNSTRQYLRVKVNLNVGKVLRRGSKVNVDGGVKVLVMFKYEHLPDFCFVCGKLDHQDNDYVVTVDMNMSLGKVIRNCGIWMKAEHLRQCF